MSSSIVRRLVSCSLSKLVFCFWTDRIAAAFLFCSLGLIPKLCNATDIINSTLSIKDGDVIISSGGQFALGFFSPGSSQNRYVGIWYNNIPAKTVVWVANRESPVLTNISGSSRLVVVPPGILVLVNETNTTIWSSNTSTSTSLNPIAQLLDNGNLVVRDENDDRAENFLWQSFDYLTDTLLPGMKLGKDFVTGLERYLSSWKSDDDPAPGDFTYHCDPTGYPQNTLKKGSVIQYRTGPWNGLRFSGAQNLRPNPIYRFYLVFNEKEVYYGYELNDPSIISRLTLSHSGFIQRWTWVDRTKGWKIYLTVPTDDCDTHSLCGPYGRCNIDNNPACGCLDKFVPTYQTQWDGADWSNGCKRRTPLDCKSDGFLNYSGIKLPDSQYTWFNKSMSLEECKKECLRNCSCVAYANLNISNGAGSGCLLWVKDLLDIRQYSGGGQDIYVRMAASDLVSVLLPSSHKSRGEVVKVLLPLLLGIALVGLTLTIYVWRKKNSVPNREEAPLGPEPEEIYPNESQNEELELPAFGFSALATATNNFSINCKIGEGGFGSVYKGLLEDGQEIAVKRLSVTSIQGLDEFKNEVICISKLQHRNLVKLLGCCIQGGEKMLIYEYMPNKSLDYFIFDEKRSNLLDWPKRLNIINGIARGLLYLHQDSRLRIIHRDLKASNILLDFDMNPKISDFGIARQFGGNQTEANTQRVVGTYGYMSPEYAVDGIFSVKSDVFSFGVLVLETVSGKKNRGFSHKDHHHNLLGHAWILQKEGRSLELIDATLSDTCYLSEVLRSIHVGLLCVQQSPEDRPSMSSVVLMLSGEGRLPQPKQPGFFAERNIFEADFTSSTKPQSSSNEVTFTLLEAR